MSWNQKTGAFVLSTAVAALAMTLVGGASVVAGEVRPFMTLDMAKKMADACEAYQEEQNLPKFNIAVVDRGADLVLFRRQDDAYLGSGKIALQKAQSSASIPFPTRTIAELVYGTDGTPPALPGLAHSDIVAFAGGLPIWTTLRGQAIDSRHHGQRTASIVQRQQTILVLLQPSDDATFETARAVIRADDRGVRPVAIGNHCRCPAAKGQNRRFVLASRGFLVKLAG